MIQYFESKLDVQIDIPNHVNVHRFIQEFVDGVNLANKEAADANKNLRFKQVRVSIEVKETIWETK